MFIFRGFFQLIYADNAATTQMSDIAYEKMLPYLKHQYGNPSSNYSFGTSIKAAVDHARKQVAVAIGAEPSEIFFTSGGSESNNWVISSIDQGHIITSSIEHHSVINACISRENKGVDVTYLPVDNKGRISIELLKNAIRPDTKLVSIILANNEIGTIQPINKIGAFLRERDILFHTDAVQAIGHIPVNVKTLNVDYLTASSHKFYGPKGIGFLYKRNNVKLKPLILGGNQERNFRAGTENVAGIVATGYALTECIENLYQTNNYISSLSKVTIHNLKQKIPNTIINGDENCSLPGIINVLFNNVEGKSLMHLLDLNGICVSTSSACASEKPSHVLRAIGLSDQQSKSAIRISYGKNNTMADAVQIVEALQKSYNKILSTL